MGFEETLRESTRPTTPPSTAMEDLGASERTTAEVTKRPSERPTAPHLPAVAAQRADVTLFAKREPEPPPRGKPTVRQMAAVVVQSTLGTLGKRLLELEIPLLNVNGPWDERIQRFQDVLVERDRLLADIRNMSGPEYDL